MTGFVYLLQRLDGLQLTKIGRSYSPYERAKQFMYHGYLLWPRYIGWVIDSSQAEAFLHRKFKDKRLSGEWFALDDDDIAKVPAFLAIYKPLELGYWQTMEKNEYLALTKLVENKLNAGLGWRPDVD